MEHALTEVKSHGSFWTASLTLGGKKVPSQIDGTGYFILDHVIDVAQKCDEIGFPDTILISEAGWIGSLVKSLGRWGVMVSEVEPEVLITLMWLPFGNRIRVLKDQLVKEEGIQKYLKLYCKWRGTKWSIDEGNGKITLEDIEVKRKMDGWEYIKSHTTAIQALNQIEF